jgi:hypothetical protein
MVETSTSRDIQAGVSQGSVLSPTLYSLYTNYAPQTPGVYRWYMYIYNRSQKGLCSQKPTAQSHLIGVVVWALEDKINEDKTQTIYFSHRRRQVEA